MARSNRPVNRSAGASLFVFQIACLFALLSLLAGGDLRQLLWLFSMMLAWIGAALGFVGLTVARTGAGRLPVAVVGMAVNVGLALILAVSAVSGA
jgi:hypothetical protein